MDQSLREVELGTKKNTQLSPQRALQEQDIVQSLKYSLNKAQIQRMKELEGQCKIIEIIYLEANQAKALFFGIIMILSVIGLLFLKNYKSLRALLFYNRLQKNEKDKATHVYVSGADKNEQICLIFEKTYHRKVTKVFEFKHLQYRILESQQIPLALAYQQDLYVYITNQYAQTGLTCQQAKMRAQFYGLNEHKVEVPAYLQYLYDCLTGPLFIFQYVVSVIYILEGVAMFGILMIVISWITTTINYILLRRSYNKIKETAQKQYYIRVLRSGEFSIIKNTELVPGDVYEPKQQIPCDSLVIAGGMFVNEASLTGQDVPIAKVKLTEPSKVNQPCHWVFEGVTIQTSKENTLAVAIDIGFASKKGRIIRKILTKSPKQPEFFMKLIYFLTQVLIISIIIYFATLKHFLTLDVETIMVVFRFLDFVACSFPAPFPLFFNLAYSCCLVRLHRDEIIGIEAQKTVQASRMKTICFDKTGTLTQNKMKLDKIFQIVDSEKIVNITNEANSFPIISGLFATCNSVEIINGEPRGDQIDLQMFLLSKGKFSPVVDIKVIRTVLLQSQSFDILKINQYESRFQSMSVLVHSQNKYYIFVKGSPQMIHLNSQLKNRRYDSFIKELSLEGYRSIAFGYREVKKQEVEYILKLDREQFLRKITILGIVSFVNELKDDSLQTIQLLTQNQINTKIITGDNIYLGIQTAIRTGMIPTAAKIVVLEGLKLNDKRIEIKTLVRNPQGGFKQSIQSVEKFEYSDQPNIFYAIDNDFIKMKEDFLNSRVKVFARISPQNKALIVRKHKEMYSKEVQSRPFLQRHFGQCGLKVGMVGDGANDLIAIKQADVGIGIAGADAVYSASFAIKQLCQIQKIINQAKNTERQAIEIVQYFGLVQLTLMMQGIILTRDASSLSSLQYVYSYFLSSIAITNLLTVSRPAEKMCKYFNTSNFMGLENHLVYWGNMIIFTAGMTLSYEYYSRTSDFVPNSNLTVTFSDGYARDTKGATIIFLCQIVINTALGVFIYRGSPWKEPFYKNRAFTVLIMINILLLSAIYFTTKHLSFMEVQPIGLQEAGVVLGIMGASAVLSLLYNKLIQKAAFHERIYRQDFKQSQIQSTSGLSEIRL